MSALSSSDLCLWAALGALLTVAAASLAAPAWSVPTAAPRRFAGVAGAFGWLPRRSRGDAASADADGWSDRAAPAPASRGVDSALLEGLNAATLRGVQRGVESRRCDGPTPVPPVLPPMLPRRSWNCRVGTSVRKLLAAPPADKLATAGTTPSTEDPSQDVREGEPLEAASRCTWCACAAALRREPGGVRGRGAAGGAGGMLIADFGRLRRGMFGSMFGLTAPTTFAVHAEHAGDKLPLATDFFVTGRLGGCDGGVISD